MTLMFLYTIVPFEIIFADDDDESEEGRKVGAEELVGMDGVQLLVRQDGAGGRVVSRILSTDPQDYLDRRWQPGTRVRV